jgi:NIPSNAP protein
LTGLRRCRDTPISRHHAPKGEALVLVDHRTYRIKPGHMNTHLAIYEEFGLKPQWRHLGEPHAYMFAESGAMNSLVHQWVYDDAADRAKRRAAMMGDPEWQVYLKKLVESNLLVDQQTSLMVPAKFSKMKR